MLHDREVKLVSRYDGLLPESMKLISSLSNRECAGAKYLCIIYLSLINPSGYETFMMIPCLISIAMILCQLQ